MRRIFILAVALYFGVVFTACRPSPAKTTSVTIGTGSISGVYYPTGGAIAKIVNKKRKEHGLLATVEPTDGSMFNVNAIMYGNLEFGMVRSDHQYQAWNGLEDWKDKGRQKDLRAVFSIHPESITLVAAVDAGIKTIKHLKRRRVNLGKPGSGLRQSSIEALEAVGIDYKKDLKAVSYNVSESAGLLQDGRIDAFFCTVVHPSESIKEATFGIRKVCFASITGVDKFLAKYPYYAKTFIPVKLYSAAVNDSNVDTFGLKATLVTSANVPDNVVYAITKEVFENFESFKKLHPAFQVLTKKGMLEGLSAPIHPGAMKYYKEAGLR
jgi:hypothetical protein